jgi:dCTP deaminase
MTILPDKAIYRLGEKLVQPFDPGRVQPASMDLCLHDEFIVFDSHEGLFIDLLDVKDKSARKVTKHADEGFVLHPGDFILAATAERITCPDNIVARLEGKSSIGRLGIMIHVTAGFVDPGWEGRLTLEVFNLRKIPIVLRPGLPFCQISFQYMACSAKNPYNGRYKGDDSVAPSRYGKSIEYLNAQHSNKSVLV